MHSCVFQNEEGCISAITAAIIDWQAPDSPLPVFAIFEADGEGIPVAMVDDGTGLDAVAGDHLYTGALPFDPRGVIPYFLIVAGDYEGAHFLNAVAP